MKKLLVVAGILVCVPGFSQAEYHTSSPTAAIEELSVRAYKHYEVDDKINNYVLNGIKNGVTIFGGPAISTAKEDANPGLKKKAFTQKLVIKSVNKIVYKFAKEHSIKLNPSDIKSGLTYTWQDLGFVNVNQYGASAGMKISF
jgi:hypothetical protein